MYTVLLTSTATPKTQGKPHFILHILFDTYQIQDALCVNHVKVTRKTLVLSHCSSSTLRSPKHRVGYFYFIKCFSREKNQPPKFSHKRHLHTHAKKRLGLAQ